MQKASPYILVLILIATAAFLGLKSSLNDKPEANTPVAEGPTDTNSAETALKTTPWAHEKSDIAADPKTIFGKLDNGFRYIIYPNPEPPARISLRLHIDAGSLMEDDDQRGIAHFLEHMMFNGSKNYKAEELIPIMQRLGIAFGAHANAYTSFDETVYMLDLPDLSKETMKLGFTVMRDFGDGALITKEEVDKERGVILSEKISRDTVGYRLMQQQFKQILPNSLVSHRFPIGTEEVIKNAPRQRFVDFYNQYYIPQRMTFVVSGDFDPNEIEERIIATFESMENPTDPGPDPDLGSFTQPDGIKTAIFHDKEVDASDVSLMLVRPFEQKPDTRENRASKMPLSIAHSILNRRFERLSKEKGSPISSGGASKFPLFNAMELGSISITAADDRWQEVVPILETEFRRALEFGFTDAELNEAKSNIINAYEQSVKQKASRKSETIASALVDTINDNKVFSDPETNLEIAKTSLISIDADACLEAYKEFWDASGYHLVLTTKEKSDSDEAALLSIYEESTKIELAPPAARAIPVFSYLNFGTPGTVTSTQSVDDLGITQLTLSNKVRINLKPTDFEKGKIRLLSRIGSGKLTQPKDMPMLDTFAQAVFEGGGLGNHSNDDLQQILAGRNVGASLMIGEEAFSIVGSTTPADFETQCQYMCALLTDPGYREEALWQFRKVVPMLEQQLKHTPAGPRKKMTAWLHGNDSRFNLATKEQLLSYTIDDAKKWLTPELTEGYLELSIVGDFKTEEITPYLLATFGALEERNATAPKLTSARKIDFPNAPAAKEFTYKSKIPQGTATTIWEAAPLRGNAPLYRRLNVLADVLGNRLREEIREKLGASYSPAAGATGSDALDNYGFLISQSVGKPEDLPLLINTMRDLADKLAQKGANQDELDRSLKPILGSLEKSKRDNGYWLNTVLSQCQENPNRLELARTRDADYKSINLKEINELAKKYLPAQNAIAVSIQPEKAN